ncbi:8-amino-7-oxononanoate synthase [Sphingosinicella sp. BN140058]|uniref:8-amino-7-oxononanoate synthase n=1 Tax=Sphingosinicella sp. BN140058 TaxID=1892855 RepID=UPI001011F627|nr:8-amino-7-oxononanoate synthase [Sphingosinicella sp. BN140058]QAY76485.1 8-amino-7-oxononanoate synthase [Sphingosinicella sp. BN140058]
MAALPELEDHLSALARIDRRRTLTPRAGRDFASNDYLGLAGDPVLRAAAAEALARGVPIGSGGSRLLRGNHEEHEALETEAARWLGAERALFFSSGYAANAALLSTLPQTGDLIVHDALIHASAHEGLRLARAAGAAAAHNDADAFDDTILAWRRSGGTGRPWLVAESLYSMDGDRAPLEALAAVAARHDGILIIDEAHATGVFGQAGRGLGAALQGRPDVITVHTCGKALGVEGALVCGPAVVRDFLVNRGRAFIFSTAPSPLIASILRAAIALVRDGTERRERLHRLAARAEAALAPLGAVATGSQILPLILGGDQATMAAAARLQAAGFDVRGIRPPTVPAGTARLRLSITLNVDERAIDALADTLREALR